MDVIKGSMCSLFAFDELNSTRFSKYTWFPKLQLFYFVSTKQILFSQFDQTTFTDMDQSHMPNFFLRQRFRGCNICRSTHISSLKGIQACFFMLLKTSFD